MEGLPMSEEKDETIVSYEDDKTYRAWPEKNASKLKTLAHSPISYHAEYAAEQRTPKSSDALEWGTAMHLWHERWPQPHEEYVEVAPASITTAAGGWTKSAAEWKASLPPDKLPLTRPMYHRLKKQTQQILENAAAVDLLNARTKTEFNVRWSWGKHRCKGRFDGGTDDVIYDLKTTRDMYPAQQFGRSAAQWFYHIQAAFYLNGAMKAGWPDHEPQFIVTSNLAPYHCSVMTIPREVLTETEEWCLRLMDELDQRHLLDWWHPADYGKIVRIPTHYFQTRREW